MKSQMLTYRMVLILVAFCGVARAETATFHADLLNVNVVDNGVVASAAPQTGTAVFTLTWDPSAPLDATIDYEIQLVGADLDGAQTTDLSDDITAVHIHDLNQCAGNDCAPNDTAGTKHVLNVYGVPRHDDADLQVFASEGRLTGLWDAGDANSLTPAPSAAPGEFFSQLMNEDIFLMVHTRAFPGGAIGGRLVPEPSSALLLTFGIPVFGFARRRCRHA